MPIPFRDYLQAVREQSETHPFVPTGDREADLVRICQLGHDVGVPVEVCRSFASLLPKAAAPVVVAKAAPAPALAPEEAEATRTDLPGRVAPSEPPPKHTPTKKH